MTTHASASERQSFLEALDEQRWDDHRYYHHCRINQTLHLVSALSFIAAYVLVFFNPVAAAVLGWLVSMSTRQIGHFFFEPKSYDNVNRATHEHKEDIKVGYNLRRKVVLMSVWGLSPVLLWWQPAMFGLFTPHVDTAGFIYNLAVLWIVVGAAAVLLRTLWLCVRKGPQTGLVWCTKILTDPFHDVRIYHKAPLYLLKGERFDPMTDWHNQQVPRA